MDINTLQRRIALMRDEVAYKELFLHFYPSLLRFSLTYVKQREIAEEIISDVLLKVWTMDTLLEISNLKVYLYSSVRNSSINFLVKNRKYTIWDIDQVAPSDMVELSTPIDLMLDAELKEKIAKSVKALPPKCRMAFMLNRQDGLSYKEVAEIMDISVNTVDRHLQIALQKIGMTLRSYLYQ
ncbi:RNA polymerase sigma-70 factor, ECF subfamily [Pedobacter steynii]|uniref:RNA polymerase sigma-70 factor, ECF subfamily n=1 Tax=Pedobacter steynii TaxID=430522 RepID=A0A1G9Y4U9_9SPHI|nr:RNA polymerase sigma-70 factor [Pedobacter steynii]NQX39611.1 RNA polymerase sigma-70 factor [Pedobacter steynii]SDN04162.1 RNA polymerase sigma-70 factor, ECF subfamily [Pedobacter steynii]